MSLRGVDSLFSRCGVLFFFFSLEVFISRVFQMLHVAVHPSCSARLCGPLALSLTSTHGVSEVPGRLRGREFPERCSQALAFACVSC